MMRKTTFRTVLIAFLLIFSAMAQAAMVKKVSVSFTGFYTDKNAAIYAQQIFYNLSSESIGRFSALADNPFTYTVSSDHKTLTFILYYTFGN